MNLYIQFWCFNGESCSYFETYRLHKLSVFCSKIATQCHIPQGSHFLFTFSIMVVQINKIDLTLTSSLNTNPILIPNLKRSRKKCEKQLRNIVSLLRYVILLKSGCHILDRCLKFFYRCILWTISNKVIKYPTTHLLCCYTILWNINARETNNSREQDWASMLIKKIRFQPKMQWMISTMLHFVRLVSLDI